MTRWFWESVGGLLVEEFQMVKREPGIAPRYADGVIILNRPSAISSRTDIEIQGCDVIVIQTKAGRLGMHLLGQTLFSLQLVQLLKPATARAVAVCAEDDLLMRRLLESHQRCSVAIYPGPK